MKRLLITALLLSLLWISMPTGVAKSDDFGTVVKVIEDFYNVKHKSLPFIARAGIKTATVAARLSGGVRKRLAEAGSVKVVFFEDQEFNSRGGIANFRARVTSTLGGKWLPFIQVLSPGDEAQTYIFLRDAGPKYMVLVVTIEKREASVVQVTLAPQTLAMLMQDPNEMGKAINDDAINNDDQE
ncbi:MAG: hypothetical protein ACR2G5_17260 [Pyrinomonadaceae bacterium]